VAHDIPQGQWYDPSIYANEALIELEKNLGMARTVHRGYDKVAKQRGSTIEVRRPGVFASGNMPIASGSDINPDYDQIELDSWKGVVFSLTDKEIGESGEVIIRDHISPAAYELARTMDASLAALYKDVPYRVTGQSTTSAYKDFTGVRRQFTDREVPDTDRWMMIGGEREEEYLNDPTFHRADSGGQENINVQVRGDLGQKFGIQAFVNQNAPVHTEGTASASDTAGAVSGAHLVGATALLVTDFTNGETILTGDMFTIAGHTRQYSAGADLTIAANGGTITISDPRGIESALAGTEVVTIIASTTNTVQNLAYNRNAFVLAMAPLSTMGDGLGTQMATIADPVTNLALRSRVWYEAKEAALYVGLDVLYGVKTLNPDLATRVQGPV